MNNEIEYEKLTRLIYQTLLAEDGISTIEVKHNVKIQGKSAKHQIDVYWEYEIAGILHRVAIECKNYNRAVSKAIVSSFYGVLADIGNINGVIVTRRGYQKGAIDFASHYGITLKQLREPEESDWNDRVKAFQTTIQIIETRVISIAIDVDEAWVKMNVKAPYVEGFRYTVSGSNDTMWVKENNGTPIKNFLQLQDELPVNDGETAVGLEHIYHFEDAYFDFENFGSIKINAIKFIYDVNNSSSTSVWDRSLTTTAILKDAKSGELKFFDQTGQLT